MIVEKKYPVNHRFSTTIKLKLNKRKTNDVLKVAANIAFLLFFYIFFHVQGFLRGQKGWINTRFV